MMSRDKNTQRSAVFELELQKTNTEINGDI